MNRIILILFAILSTQVFAQRSQQELSRLKAKSPYCVDKLEEFKGRLFWSISNSCYMLKEHLAITPKPVVKKLKRKVASIPKPATRSEKKITPISSKQESKAHQFSAGISANHYSTDVSTESLAAQIGYEYNFSNSFEVQATLEVEKFMTISSESFEAEINKPVFNASFIGFKKLDKFKVGAEIGAKHYLQVIDTPSDVRFDITPFLTVGGVAQYALTDSIELGTSAAYLKASDDLNSKGYELKAFGSYSFGEKKKYSLVPHASISKIENSLAEVTNNKFGAIFQVGF